MGAVEMAHRFVIFCDVARAKAYSGISARNTHILIKNLTVAQQSNDSVECLLPSDRWRIDYCALQQRQFAKHAALTNAVRLLQAEMSKDRGGKKAICERCDGGTT